MESNVSQVAEVATLGAGGLMALAYSIHKLIKGWKTDSAEVAVITMMREQLQILSEHNITLRHELAKLQDELITLNKELGTLSKENQRLHSDVNELTAQISNLKHKLAERSAD